MNPKMCVSFNFANVLKITNFAQLTDSNKFLLHGNNAVNIHIILEVI